MPHHASELYLGIPGWVYLWFLANVVLFGILFGVWRYVSVLSSARPEIRSDHPFRRTTRTARQLFGQLRRLDEWPLGVSYLIVLWAMLCHLIAVSWDVFRGTFIEIIQAMLTGDTLPYTNEVPDLSWLLAGVATIGLAGLITAGFVRYVFTPERLQGRHRWTLTPVLVGFVFLSSIAVAILQTSGAGMVAWWLRICGVAAVMAYVTFSKDRHLLFAAAAIWSASSERNKLPPPSQGASELTDFTWRELLNGLACSSCGRCEVVCPACTTLRAGSPRNLMSKVADAVTHPADSQASVLAGTSLNYLWSCDTCGACMEVCPSFNEHVPAIVEMRRWLVRQGRMPQEISIAINNLTATGNYFGLPAEERGRWTESLDFVIPDARQKPVEYLWVVGDEGSYHPVAIEATLATARVLHRAGVDFGIVYEAERNAGNDARRAGAEDLFRSLHDHNARVFAEAHFLKIVTADPHTYNVLKHEYDWDGKPPAVMHVSELLGQLFRRGCPPIAHELRGGVVYHDPCYLGRYNGIYDAPRRVLQELGLDLIEFPHNRDMAQCCGGGGGRVWTGPSVPNGIPTPGDALVREAAERPGVRMLAVACPADLILLQNAARSAGLSNRLPVRDILEIVDDATRPVEVSTRTAPAG